MPKRRGLRTGRLAAQHAENFPKNLELVEKLSAIAAKKGCTAGQLALAWLMAQGPDVIPIPETNKARYLEENLGSLGVVLGVGEGEVGEIREAVEGCVTASGGYGQGLWEYARVGGGGRGEVVCRWGSFGRYV